MTVVYWVAFDSVFLVILCAIASSSRARFQVDEAPALLRWIVFSVSQEMRDVALVMSSLRSIERHRGGEASLPLRPLGSLFLPIGLMP